MRDDDCPDRLGEEIATSRENSVREYSDAERAEFTRRRRLASEDERIRSLAVAGENRDFNDVFAADGADAVREAIGAAVRHPAIDPVDLWRRYSAPELPSGLLPPVIECFARTHGETMGVDPAGLAMAALAVCAAAITDDIKVQVKRHDNWRESARLWVGLVGARR